MSAVEGILKPIKVCCAFAVSSWSAGTKESDGRIPRPAAAAASESGCWRLTDVICNSLLLWLLQRREGPLHLDSLFMMCWHSTCSVCLQQQQQQ